LAADDHGEARAPHYLTTREVADLLRVKERKVYDLAAAGEIPHRRVTGKLLFPRDEIEAWIAGEATQAPADRPMVLAGSHDPLLDWAIRESGCGLASFTDGSMDGLDRFAQGAAALTGLHLPEDDGWNLKTVAARGFRDCVLLGWARRSQGLILGPQLAGAVRTIADLKGHSVALRQSGAGGRALFDRLALAAGLAPTDFVAVTSVARTETDAAASVASGEAEAAIGLEAMARQFRLGFLPLAQERFDLLVDRRAYFTPPLQALFAFARSAAFRARADAMGGYDVAEAGSVRWLSD
jgi:excisionase family DNA binding protein